MAMWTKRGGLASSVALVALGAVGCSGVAQDEPAGDDERAAASSGPACSSPGGVSTRYDVLLREGACVPLVAGGGSWHPSPLFPQSPQAVRSASCSYQWRPSVAGAAPDPAPVLALRNAFVTPNCSSSQVTCATQGSCPSVVVSVPPPIFPEVSGSSVKEPGGGANGCDVCAVQEGGEVFVVEPPGASFTHVDLSLESTVSFLPGAPPVGGAAPPLPPQPVPSSKVSLRFPRPPNAQSFVVQLPPPPAGRAYVSGPVRLW
jgi:cell division septation protein DedD